MGRLTTTMDLDTIDLEAHQFKKYHLTGVKCHGCATKLTKHLQVKIPSIGDITYQPDTRKLTFETPSNYIPEHVITIVREIGNYSVVAEQDNVKSSTSGNWLTIMSRLYPLWLIVAYLTTSVIVYDHYHPRGWMVAMQLWMGLFYMVFSFFKLINLSGFVTTFQRYDMVAGLIPPYAYVYPFLEVVLGIAYLLGYQITIANIVTIVIFTENLGGVVRSQMKGENLECACLGSLLNLPLSTVTLAEDTLMIVMAILGLVY